MQGLELDLMMLVGPFELKIFREPMDTVQVQMAKHTEFGSVQVRNCPSSCKKCLVVASDGIAFGISKHLFSRER